MIDPHKLYHRVISAGEEWADRDAAATLLEETKKSLIAQLAARHHGKSRIEAEQLALASEEYRDHVRTMVAARQAANRARVSYDAAKMYSELLRSVESTRRAEALLAK